MRKILILFILLYAGQSIRAQNTETDSLKKLLPITPESPKRVLLLESLSYAYLSAYPDTALQYALEGLNLAQKINDPRGEAYCTNALGNVYFAVGDYPKALEMYLKSLKMKEALGGEQRAIAVTYFNIANVYTEQEDYPHALSYLFKTKAVDESEKDSSGILFDLYSLGNIYLRTNQPDSAFDYTEQSYRLAQRMQDNNLMGAILNNYGEVYAYLKNFPMASVYYHLSIPYTQAVNDNEVLSANYFGLAKVCHEKDATDSAIYYARKALLLAQEAPFLKKVLEASAFLTEIFKAKKQFDSAFRYQELTVATRDSLYNVEKIKKVQNMKLLEQQRQQSIETAKLEYRNKIRLYSVIFASGIFLFIALLLWRNNKQKQKAYGLLQQQKAKTDEALNELKSTQAQLIQREKMASLGELTAGIAHEIKNPLNFINNFSELNTELLNELKEERHREQRSIGTEDEVHEYIRQNLERIIYHGKRADSIIKNMLEHSQASGGEKQLFDLNDLTNEHLRLTYHVLQAKNKFFTADLQTEFDTSIGEVNMVPEDIGRVLLNLFNNAFYAVNQKQQKMDDSYNPVVRVKTQRMNGKIEISVWDNGVGIPRDVLPKIFQPFFTTKPTGQGTGLGLSLSWDIITKTYGGELKVDTREGEFTEFVIELPA